MSKVKSLGRITNNNANNVGKARTRLKSAVETRQEARRRMNSLSLTLAKVTPYLARWVRDWVL